MFKFSCLQVTLIVYLLTFTFSSPISVYAQQSKNIYDSKKTHSSNMDILSLYSFCEDTKWLSLLIGFPSAPSCKVFSSPTKDTSPITLTFGGDVLMEYSLVDSMIENGPTYPFLYVKDLFLQSDYSVINLETPVTSATSPFPKQYNFKASPLLLEGLKDAGVDMVSLANNHTMDYHEEGLLDTLSALKKAQIEYIGAGRNSEEAYAEKRVRINGQTISFLAFSEVLPDFSWYAQVDKPGIASGYQIDRATRIVGEVKKDSDYVIVYYHWGDEKHNQPNQVQKQIARTLIDHGADAIVGSHPHVLQGFETYKNKPIAYSLGNFLFPDYVSGKTAETGVLQIELDHDKITMAFHPHVLHKNQIIPLTEQEKAKQFKYLETISFETSFDIEGTIIPNQKNY
ncbi:CapA family protein [Pontibacillus yanchengensis]|uniref:Capsule synthesis protein CapA domain-containing protein n=1 Tax=Pontibacillus yanchengensis Y32 TaxID=1385514 RepID=A0A0A2T4R0_9BACI|nr:CapA family protein [Pontibacillus yanchengensis]KGP70777.1 hypothetical protein N782_04315 [Pontibacillus yanchengensis Y32]